MSWVVGAVGLKEYIAVVPFGEDDFNDTAGTLLAAHTADRGGPWIQVSNWVDWIVTDANRVRPNANFAWRALTATPATPDYDVEADFVIKDLSGTNRIVAITGRQQIAAQTAYLAEAFVTGGVATWRLRKYIAGTPTTIAILGSPAVGTYRVKLQMRGTAIKLFVNGVQTISATDSSIAAAGTAGIHSQGVTPNSNTEGVHLDNFLATDA